MISTEESLDQHALRRLFLSLARDHRHAYISTMHPVVNIDDPVGKVVGKRRPTSKLISSPQETEANRQWAAAGFFPRIKKGVYRFKSHEEADQWLMDHSIPKPVN